MLRRIRKLQGAGVFVRGRTSCFKSAMIRTGGKQLRNWQQIPSIPSVIVGSPVGRWKGDFPEIGRGRIEFNGDMKTFGSFPRGPDHAARHALTRAAMLEHQAC